MIDAMSDYQVIARKYRPKTFKEVLGQDSIVTTLKNAIKRQAIAHAYLFCGSRGTGKTTLARVFAKALNCLTPTSDGEPCNTCSSCLEISQGHSLDVLEIDGASNRGIDDIRKINETVGYASSNRYKIFIIDEVHMLTKEAFNALLKTLEEPPAKVKFFFATTEPHKVLPTILSRCQRFNLNRISIDQMVGKLRFIANELKVTIDDDALWLLANRAEGGLRDAESLFDQILAFHDGIITKESVLNVLGMMPKESFFTLDQKGKEGDLSFAFHLSHEIFSQGKDFQAFVEGLIEHFRTILMIKLSGAASMRSLTDSEKVQYEKTSQNYTKEQVLTILDLLTESVNLRLFSNQRVTLEMLLLKILRIHQRIPVEILIKKLAELEGRVKGGVSNISEDPTPAPAEIPVKKVVKEKVIEKEPAPIDLGARLTPEAKTISRNEQCKVDTLLQFASVELEGTLQKRR